MCPVIPEYNFPTIREFQPCFCSPSYLLACSSRFWRTQVGSKVICLSPLKSAVKLEFSALKKPVLGRGLFGTTQMCLDWKVRTRCADGEVTRSVSRSSSSKWPDGSREPYRTKTATSTQSTIRSSLQFPDSSRREAEQTPSDSVNAPGTCRARSSATSNSIQHVRRFTKWCSSHRRR